MKIGVLGAGSWGTALTTLLSDNGHDVTVWSVDEKEIEMLDTKREHETKLPGVHLSEDIVFTIVSFCISRLKNLSAPYSKNSHNTPIVIEKQNATKHK